MTKLAEVVGEVALQSRDCLQWLFSLALSQIRKEDLSDGLLKAWLSLVLLLASHIGTDAWKEVLKAATRDLPLHSTKIQSRAVQCILLCNCAQRLGARKNILEHALRYSQDLDASLRLCIASQLPTLMAATASDSAVQNSVLQEVSMSMQKIPEQTANTSTAKQA